MRFNCFIVFRPLAFIILTFFFGGGAWAQAPLTEDRIAQSDTSDSIQLDWQTAGAERAAQAGLPSVSETIFRSLLQPSYHWSAAQLASIKTGLAKALIGQGRYEAARAQLEAVSPDQRSAAHALYLAIAIYGLGEGEVEVEVDAFQAALTKVDETKLSVDDQPWFALLQGLHANLKDQPKQARAAYERAAELTEHSLLRSYFESLVLRQRLMQAPPDEALAAELRAKISEFEGEAAAYPYVREYAVTLYSMDRIGEAVGAIERELKNVSVSYEADKREQLRLLKGIILGADSESGRAALKELIRDGHNREAMGIALQLLARTPEQEADLLGFLKEMINRKAAHPLLGQMHYLRSQLAIRDPEMRSIAEEDARILLEQFPGLSGITNVYRLLAYAALEREPPQYRAAADFLIQLRDQTKGSQGLVELNGWIGDCYFLNQDFVNAVDFYAAARSHELGADRDGELFLRLVSAQAHAGQVDAALQLIDEVDFGGKIELADRWRAEWNVAQSLQTSGQLKRALKRVRLLLQDAKSDAGSVPAALDMRLRWLEAYLSHEAQEMEGLAERVAKLLARLEAMPAGKLEVDAAEIRLLKTEILLLQGSVLLRDGEADAGMKIFERLRNEFMQTAAAQRSYLFEAAYHGLVGDFDSAQETLIYLAETYPESALAPQALFEAALYCERRGAEFYPEAVVLHNDLAERYASDPLFYFARLKQGNLLRSMNDFAGAQTVYENLINGFPEHEMRYVAELSQADCMLALAGNESSALVEVIAILERLLDLPNLPLDFQAEVAYKWAFSLLKNDANEKAKEVLSLAVSRFLLDEPQAKELGAAGRYWVARSMLQLGELLEEKNAAAEARRIYRKLIDYNLPGRHIAISRADRLLDVE